MKKSEQPEAVEALLMGDHTECPVCNGVGFFAALRIADCAHCEGRGVVAREEAGPNFEITIDLQGMALDYLGLHVDLKEPDR